MTNAKVPVPGATLNVEIEGDGPPVLVPSGAGSAFYRNTLSPGLKWELQLVYVDLRATGDSTGSLEGATFASFADDLEAVRKALGLERVLVLGHSNHGCIALEYGLRHPVHAAGVIPVASAPDFRRAFTLGQQRFEELASPEARATLARLQQEFEALPLETMSADEQMYRRYLSMAPTGWRDLDIDQGPIWGGPPRGMAAYFGWMFGFAPTWNLVPRLDEVTVPVLAVSGRHDFLCPAELWDGATERLRGGTLVVIEEAAHNPQYECAAEFDRAVLEFVDRVWR